MHGVTGSIPVPPTMTLDPLMAGFLFCGWHPVSKVLHCDWAVDRDCMRQPHMDSISGMSAKTDPSFLSYMGVEGIPMCQIRVRFVAGNPQGTHNLQRVPCG